MEIMSVLWTIVIGMASGIVAACLGYAKGTKLERIDYKKFFGTVIVGAIIGGFAGQCGWSYDQAYQFFLTTGMIYVVENMAKAIVRRFPGLPKEKKAKVKKGEDKPIEDEEE